jgi:hypothetical protein
MDNKNLMCPSSVCREGAVLIGIVMPDGRIGYSAEQVKVDADFVETARQGRQPEKRFRFAGTCVKSGCGQWTGSRCGVIDHVAEEFKDVAVMELPQCSIRDSCRWFAQLGAEACGVCPLVVTDLIEEQQAIEAA